MGSQLRRGAARFYPTGVCPALVAGAVTLLTGFAASPAWAGLEICNHTDVHRSVAVGYSQDDVWMSEGWWNLDPGQCAMPIQGDLEQRYYYYRAEAEDGSFPGEGYTFCTEPRTFTIAGDENCEDRGYATEDFSEIDTGEVATTFAYAITNAALAAGTLGVSAADAVTGPTDSGLHICNRTDVDRNVAIGYTKDDVWTSEGWWTLEPDQCANPIEGDLTQRYYYVRAEDPSERFEGEGYTFCAVDDAFTIVGDENCEDRGYETLSFTEIDTGPEALGYVFVLDADTSGMGESGAGPIETPGSDTSSGPADSGLRICNQSSISRYLAIGYLQDEQWVSEGWWHLETGQCADTVADDLTQRYYYYRAEDPNEQYDGEGYMFCTIDDAFTIVGDENCEARGYEEHDFSEIDTGPEALGYVFVIQDGDGVAPAPSESPTSPASPTSGKHGQVGDSAPGPVTTLPSGQSVPPGTQGGPIDVTGVFLGCEVADGATLCTVRGVDGRYVISDADTDPAAMETLRSLEPNQQLRVQGGILAHGDTGIDILANTVTPILKGDGPVDRTRNGVQGGWQSLDDPQASIRFEDGLYADYYQGDLMAEGGYSVAMACPDNPGSGGEDPVIVVRLAGEGAPACYTVMYMDGMSLEMLALPRGNLLRYQRRD